jgi:hypothetical protein
MSLHADWKSASPGAHAPSVGLRQRKEHPPGRRRPSRRLEIGLPRRSRARRRPPPTQRALFRSAQADRWPKAPQGRIHSAHPAPGVGLRRRKGHPPGRRRLSRRLKSAFSGAYAPGVGLRRRKERFSGRRRPTVGRRPPEAEFIRRPRPSRRLKSASPGAARRASAFADARDALSVGAGRPSAESPPGRIHSAPKAFTPIEIGLQALRPARPPPTQRDAFLVGAGSHAD